MANFCPHCGKAKRPTAKFCIQCGSALGDVQNGTRASSKRANKAERVGTAARRRWPWILGIASVLALAAAVTFLLTGSLLFNGNDDVSVIPPNGQRSMAPVSAVEGNVVGERPMNNSAAPEAEASINSALAPLSPVVPPAQENVVPTQRHTPILDWSYMIGRWTDDGNCSNSGPTAISFLGNGSFVASNGGTGRWRLDGDRLTLSGRATATIRIIPTGPNAIDVINENGSRGRSTRCL